MNVVKELTDLMLEQCDAASVLGLTPAEQSSCAERAIFVKNKVSSLNQSLAFLESASKGDKNALEQAFDKGVDTTGCYADGVSALFSAAYHGHVDCVGLLLSHGADPKVNRNDGMTPLMAAAWAGSEEGVRLLEQQCDPLAFESEGKGMTALMYAAIKGAHECVRLLIPHGGVDARDYRGNNALMLVAEQHGSLSTVQALMGHSDLKAKNSGGNDVFEISKLKGRADISGLIASYQHALFEMSHMSDIVNMPVDKPKKSLSL